MAAVAFKNYVSPVKSLKKKNSFHADFFETDNALLKPQQLMTADATSLTNHL